MLGLKLIELSKRYPTVLVSSSQKYIYIYRLLSITKPFHLNKSTEYRRETMISPGIGARCVNILPLVISPILIYEFPWTRNAMVHTLYVPLDITR